LDSLKLPYCRKPKTHLCELSSKWKLHYYVLFNLVTDFSYEYIVFRILLRTDFDATFKIAELIYDRIDRGLTEFDSVRRTLPGPYDNVHC